MNTSYRYCCHNTDAHVHFEHQPYTRETLEKMVKTAMDHGITELRVLDHTHKFLDFDPLYEPTKTDPVTYKWYRNHKQIPLKVYEDFIAEMKKENWPITVKFGLEVCYFPQTEDWLRDFLSGHSFDFLIGSIHFVDGYAIDLTRDIYFYHNVNTVYKRYYAIMELCITSGLFDHLGHPDSIKVFETYPDYNLEKEYIRIAEALQKAGMTTENNTGLKRYHYPYLGIHPYFGEILKQHHVPVLMSSDAHVADDVGFGYELAKFQ
ncbi:MAG: histidinol-phosphatase HisJ family protein [Erysipelotrichaceae bacterium]|nr:histidinol-phosphatase HisJ family protein [Erysipelotrichaceae bacterium]